MSVLSPFGKTHPDWPSIWFEWPLLFYREWLTMLQASAAPKDLITVRKLGMTESAQEMVLVAEAPAFKDNELDVTIQENMLDIRGERHEQVAGGELHIRYERKIPLPPSVASKVAKASVRDGIVEVHIPKRPGIDALAS